MSELLLHKLIAISDAKTDTLQNEASITLFKLITGGDNLGFPVKYIQEFREGFFKSTLLLSSNSGLGSLKDTGFDRRLIHIAFTYQPEKIELDLAKKLCSTLVGIYSWALTCPSEYKINPMNAIGQTPFYNYFRNWLNTRLLYHKSFYTSQKELQQDYKNFMFSYGKVTRFTTIYTFVQTLKAVVAKIMKISIAEKRISNRRVIAGVKLASLNSSLFMESVSLNTHMVSGKKPQPSVDEKEPVIGDITPQMECPPEFFSVNDPGESTSSPVICLEKPRKRKFKKKLKL